MSISALDTLWTELALEQFHRNYNSETSIYLRQRTCLVWSVFHHTTTYIDHYVVTRHIIYFKGGTKI